MFRKLRDGISAAANALAGSTGEQQGVQSLQSMGFGATDARSALQACNGDVERAASMLLASNNQQQQQQHHHRGRPATTNNTNNTANSNDDEAALAAALQESLQTEEARQLEAARVASADQPPPPSAATVRAGEAAQLRAAQGRKTSKSPPRTTGIGAHHPAVKMPTKLEHRPKEEQLLRCADRMKTFPRAVDTLYIALTSIQKDPANDKFRKIDKTTAGFQRTLKPAPGAEDMLKAMNFVERGPSTLVLTRDRVDPALLYLGIGALETTRETPEYKKGKQKLQFEKQMLALLTQSDASETEAIARANHMSKCPTEPSDGKGALMQIKLNEDTTIRRRFDGDDTLEDILNWLGGHASALPNKILSREWSLMDMNRYPLAPMDCEEDRNKTLQFLGCWPSGRLEIAPSDEGWHQRKSIHVKM
ncbi:expressed unknown protein [Seminavis robusta]|uniref:UBA domain-containing protein n=1 Tax=Seminavis robusta TaxID=568900 RepID=A0A9N8H8D6_9STRA|nr:expressed unknown protein [Seminavis robusta]|eukprot:Sro214_g088680.1 n/a (421) ;mRNA; f:20349-21611